MSTPRIFDTEIHGNTLIIVPSGNVGSLAGENVHLEIDGLLGAFDKGELRHAVFDFSKVPYFGSSMLGAMHMVWKRVSEGSGRMYVCNVSDVEREVLQVSKFDVLWPIHDSREEALASIANPG